MNISKCIVRNYLNENKHMNGVNKRNNFFHDLLLFPKNDNLIYYFRTPLHRVL